MSQALYQKYRPQTFSEVIGQEHILVTLLNQLKAKKFSHAYLFCGPRGIGKTTLARLMAKSVNCLDSKNGEPCNKCVNCDMISRNKALDIIEIDAASHTGVDNVRENIIDNALVSPSILPNKVFIIDEVHMLSISAFSALLKILEEPPKRIVFILATTEIHKVPATIISRCQRFDFKKVSAKEIVNRLKKIVEQEKVLVDLEVLERIAKNSEGCARDAESLLSQIMALDDKHITAAQAELVLPNTELALLLEFFRLLADKNSKACLELINKLTEDGVDLLEFNKSFLEFLRKLMLYKIMGKLSDLENLDLDKEAHGIITQALEKVSALDLVRIIRVFLEKNEQLKGAIIVQLPLELAVIQLTQSDATQDFVIKKKAYLNKEAPTMPLRKPAVFVKNNDLPAGEIDDRALREIREKMPQIIRELRKQNHSLALTFVIAYLVSLSKDNQLTIGVKYKFHRDRLCDIENRTIIEQVLEKELNKPIKLVCLVDDKYEVNNILTKSAQSDNLDTASEDDVKNVWDLAVNTFGSDT